MKWLTFIILAPLVAMAEPVLGPPSGLQSVPWCSSLTQAPPLLWKGTLGDIDCFEIPPGKTEEEVCPYSSGTVQVKTRVYGILTDKVFFKFNQGYLTEVEVYFPVTSKAVRQSQFLRIASDLNRKYGEQNSGEWCGKEKEYEYGKRVIKTSCSWGLDDRFIDLNVSKFESGQKIYLHIIFQGDCK